jgi:hypothetical protein|tara:strand:- start:288 stop:860 length:573 start_codon:yes stop_codon:yes gene_type:complete
MRVDVLFPVAILSHQVDDKLADAVESKFLEKLQDLPKLDEHYGDYFLTERVLDLENDTPKLYNEILNCRDNYYAATGLDSTDNIVEFWTQDYREKGHRHGMHQHGIHGISGVYWIRANEHASDLKFYNPNKTMTFASHSEKTSFSSKEHSYTATKGTILLFPSYLDHEVGAAKEGTVRSTISFNFPLKLG